LPLSWLRLLSGVVPGYDSLLWHGDYLLAPDRRAFVTGLL
jgi:hypothetical protein